MSSRSPEQARRPSIQASWLWPPPLALLLSLSVAVQHLISLAERTLEAGAGRRQERQQRQQQQPPKPCLLRATEQQSCLPGWPGLGIGWRHFPLRCPCDPEERCVTARANLALRHFGAWLKSLVPASRCLRAGEKRQQFPPFLKPILLPPPHAPSAAVYGDISSQ